MLLRSKHVEGNTLMLYTIAKAAAVAAFISLPLFVYCLLYLSWLLLINTRDIDARRVAAMGSGERSERVRTYNFPQVFIILCSCFVVSPHGIVMTQGGGRS